MKLQNLLPQQWAAMTPYQRFESVAAIAMMLLVTLVIVVAVIRMASDVISGPWTTRCSRASSATSSRC